MDLLPPPGPQRTRQLVMLGVVAIVASGLAWRECSPRQAGMPAAASNSPAAAGGAVSKVLPEPVRLGELEPVPVAPESRRNLFRFGVKPVPPPLPAPPVVAQPPPFIPPPPAPTGPPPIPLKALGRQVIPVPAGMVIDPVTGLEVQQVEQRTVVTLKDPATGRVVDAVEGQIIDGKYKVLKIGLQSVEMSYLDGSGFRRIPIGG